MQQQPTGIDEFLNALASRTPTPGGGAAAGACGALACALAEMVAAYSIGRSTPQRSAPPQACPSESADAAVVSVHDILTRLGVCRRMLRQLMSEDAAAYEAMTQARREAKADPTRLPAAQSAVLAAARVPMEIQAAGATALALMDGLKEQASPYLLSDLGAAAVLALAAVRAADYSVRVNLDGLPDPVARPCAEESDRILAHAERLAEAVASRVRRAPAAPPAADRRSGEAP